VLIAAEGGVGAIIAAMHNCKYDVSVQHYACWALGNIAWASKQVQSFARQEGAVDAVQCALANHSDSSEVVDKANTALTVLQGLHER
jgi:Armadillo/beta-catenin-like repeat